MASRQTRIDNTGPAVLNNLENIKNIISISFKIFSFKIYFEIIPKQYKLFIFKMLEFMIIIF